MAGRAIRKVAANVLRDSTDVVPAVSRYQATVGGPLVSRISRNLD